MTDTVLKRNAEYRKKVKADQSPMSVRIQHVRRVYARFNDIACSSLALGPDHGSTLGYPTQGLAQVTGATNERNFEVVFVDVVLIIRRCEHLGFVDVIDTNGLENLRTKKIKACLEASGV